jgi:outer membrane lipoprotein carrier protein
LSSRKISGAALVAALLALTSPLVSGAQAKELSADEVVSSVQGFYAGVEDYRAAFVQTTAHKMFAGRLERAYGQVLFKKGGLMRWEYERPDAKLFVYDGAVLWIYEPEVPQIFKGAADAERLRRALAFLTGEGKILDEYTAKKISSKKMGFPDGHVLKLKPKQKNSPFNHVELYVDGADFHVVRSVVVDHEGNRNRLDFEKPETNVGLPAGMFEFNPPKGVPVIEGPPQQ